MHIKRMTQAYAGGMYVHIHFEKHVGRTCVNARVYMYAGYVRGGEGAGAGGYRGEGRG